MQGWHRSHIQSETAACLTGLGGFLTIAWRRFVPGWPEKATAACFRLPTWMSEEAGGCDPWVFIHRDLLAPDLNLVGCRDVRLQQDGHSCPSRGCRTRMSNLRLRQRRSALRIATRTASYGRSPNTPVTTRSFPHRSRRIVTDSNPAASSIPPTGSH